MPRPDLIELSERLGLKLSVHAWKRMCARRISPEAVCAALRFGRVVQQDGALVYFIGRKEVKRWSKSELRPHAGLHVVTSRDGTIITAYRNHELNANPRRGRARFAA